VRYKAWRSTKDKALQVVCREGSAAFDALPIVIQHLGPWTGSNEGEIDRLRLPLRLLLVEQGFVILHCHVSKLDLESVAACGPCIRKTPNVCNAKGWTACQCIMCLRD
jgi:hypothetical protein